jgi:hypothetical protein
MQARTPATPTLAALAALTALAWPGAAMASPAGAALHRCSAGKLRLALHVARADRAPSGGATKSASSIVKTQLREAAKAASGACPGSAHASVRARDGRIVSLYRHGHRARARRMLTRLLAQLRRSNRGGKAAHGASWTPAARAASGCSFDGSVHIKLRDANGVADDLAAAAAAQQIGDERAADEALGAAREAFAEWVHEGAGGAQSAGDWASVAAAAELLGSESIAAEALADARTAAREALDAAEKLGACSVTTNDAPCVMRALTAAILLGVDRSGDMEAVKGLLEASSEAGKSNCEEWTLSVSISEPSGWSMDWGPSAFVVDRKAGTISDAAGVGGGWPGEIPSTTGPCTENGVQVGTGTLSGSSFHFNITGQVIETGFLLELASLDNHVTVTVQGPVVCQALGALGEMFVNAFLQAPFPVNLSVAPGQTGVDTQEAFGEATLHETASRVR